MKKKAKTHAEASTRKSHGELLFEIGAEEIPAGMIAKAAGELKALLRAKLVETGLLEEIARR